MGKEWSKDAVELTIKSLEFLELNPGPEGACFKHIDGHFGCIALSDLSAGRFQIQDRQTDKVSTYGSIEELVADGWVLD